jgi:hypothetical protein
MLQGPEFVRKTQFHNVGIYWTWNRDSIIATLHFKLICKNAQFNIYFLNIWL